MMTVELHTAQQQLVALIEAAAHGEVVIIARSDGSAFRLVARLPDKLDVDAAAGSARDTLP